MRPRVNIYQTRRIDVRIALCRRKTFMTEQLLNGPKIPAARQKMGCETMAQGVGRGSFGKAECAAQTPDFGLDDFGP